MASDETTLILHIVQGLEKKIDAQGAEIIEIKERTLIPKDAKRIDLFMAVFRENPNKSYATAWLIIAFLVFDKTGIISNFLKNIIGFAVAGG